MSVLAIAEHRDGHFRKVTYEALSEGRRIADGMGTDMAALVMGSGVEAVAGELGKYGADMVRAVSCAKVPRIQLVIGPDNGAANYGMCGRGFNPRFLFAWPNSRIATMAADTAETATSERRRHHAAWRRPSKSPRRWR